MQCFLFYLLLFDNFSQKMSPSIQRNIFRLLRRKGIRNYHDNTTYYYFFPHFFFLGGGRGLVKNRMKVSKLLKPPELSVNKCVYTLCHNKQPLFKCSIVKPRAKRKNSKLYFQEILYAKILNS